MAGPAPEFGGPAVARMAEPCAPRELYRALLAPEDHVHYLEPAFTFAAALLAAPATDLAAAGAAHGDLVESLLRAAREELACHRLPAHAGSWPARIAREFAPTGLTDGAWLIGLCSVGQVEDEVGMAALRQLMVRCGDPGSAEAHGRRYAALLRSLGVSPGSIARWDLDELMPCAEISYEHSLVGLALGLFPTAFKPEVVGFNLWMAAIGPCPLLLELAASLRSDGACLTYVERYDRASMTADAVAMTRSLIADAADETLGLRLARGFFAAHHSYVRWRRAMSGANVPMTPRQVVVEIVGRKARFAIGHHGAVDVGGSPIETFFAGGKASHEQLVSHLAASPWVRPGDPAASRLVTDLVSLDGPMFDIFTAGEQRALREWIVSLGAAAGEAPVPDAVPLEGTYTPPQDPESLHRYARNRFGGAPFGDLLYHLVNADRCPAIRIFARGLADNVLGRIRTAFEKDPRLGAAPPRYSEQAVAEMVVHNHARNVATQQRERTDAPDPAIGTMLDGGWLQGFADVARIGHEEYGWLFRIFASEMGDGKLRWNHNYIARRMYQAKAPDVMLPATDRRFFDSVRIDIVPIIYIAMSLNTRRFLPELLGLNLGIEATGVCGTYVGAWRSHERRGEDWGALYHRLHNSIDNYASGHTKWSLSAVQSYLARVAEVAPHAVERQWTRIWHFWRLLEIQAHGAPPEMEALKQGIGGMADESFVPSLM